MVVAASGPGYVVVELLACEGGVGEGLGAGLGPSSGWRPAGGEGVFRGPGIVG
jgi:hypothetical protein